MSPFGCVLVFLLASIQKKHTHTPKNKWAPPKLWFPFWFPVHLWGGEETFVSLLVKVQEALAKLQVHLEKDLRLGRSVLRGRRTLGTGVSLLLVFSGPGRGNPVRWLAGLAGWLVGWLVASHRPIGFDLVAVESCSVLISWHAGQPHPRRSDLKPSHCQPTHLNFVADSRWCLGTPYSGQGVHVPFWNLLNWRSFH